MSNKESLSGRKIKIALFGCGKMGKHHIRAIQLQDCADIIAVVDPLVNSESLRTIIPEDAKVFHNSKELFTYLKPDVVHITTPPSTHANLARLALNHGSNVYVEKPFTLSASDAKDIISLADEKGLKVCAGHQVLFEKSARKSLEILSEIGQIVHIESFFSFRTVRKNITPVDQLIDILPHPVYLLLHFLKAGLNSKEKEQVELTSLDVATIGEVRGILRVGNISGVLIVTLRGRPIESYLRIVGTNGSLYVDFVHGTITKLIGPGTSVLSIILNPYIQAKQTLLETTKSFVKLAFGKQKSYPGLSELIGVFYSSILNSSHTSPLSPSLIIETVSICETVSDKLREAELEADKQVEKILKGLEAKLSPVEEGKKFVIVTGGTGFLGSKVVADLRNYGWPVRVFARHIPFISNRIPGVQYVIADLAEQIPIDLFEDVGIVVHCAAETAGGKEEHERNTIRATHNIIYAAAKAKIKRFVLISSIAVIKTSREMGGALDETTPLDIGNLNRGPYIWGKAEAERLTLELGKKMDIAVRIIRPGPLVDFNEFEAPGRLGRELGPFFVAVGRRSSNISVCDVHTASKVILSYVNNIDSAPLVLNLVESPSNTRAELVARLREVRSDLKVFWVPMFIIRGMSPFLKLLQKWLFPGKKPIDIADAFTSEKYKTDLAAQVIKQACCSSTTQSSLI